MLQRLSLSARLSFALSVTALLLVGAGGAWQVTAEETDLRRSVERHLRLLGRSLQVAFENALRDRQAEDVEETLHALERIDPSVDIFVYDAAGQRIASSTGATERGLRLGADSSSSELRFRDDAPVPSAELRLPLRIRRDRPAATLVVVHPLQRMHADLAATRQRVALSTGAFVIVVFLVTMVLSRFWVGTPLARMVAQMRRVRAGDFSPSPAQTGRRDEIGATLHEFEALVADLAEARVRLETEADVRRRLERAVREVDKLATVGQLAAGLAHEIGSPLQILEGRVAALEAKADDPAETRRLARILREQTQRITRIVSRLVSLARRPAAVARPLDAGPPVQTVVDLLEGEARRRGVGLTLTIAADLPRLRGDPDSLQQVALNLLRNALDATPRGGTIQVRMTPTELTHLEGPTVPGVRLEVRDTGRGMTDDVRARVFEPFFTTRSPAGTGLGLAVVKSIVDERRGRIRFESEPGRGTTFVVELPADPSSGKTADVG